MAYNLVERFSQPPQYYRVLDPGAYQFEDGPASKPSKVPFLSKTPRITGTGNKIWTHTLYYTKLPPKIPNCTAMMSKIPRFTYDINDCKEQIDELICQCEDPNICECEITDDVPRTPEIICQAKMPRTLYKGSTQSPDINLRDKLLCEPPFYDANVKYSTEFYQGCKWSKWDSNRSTKTIETSPGPAYYTIEKNEPTFDFICAEKIRAQKRKTSKQLRFIEMVQHRNIVDNLPGPSYYSPKIPQDSGVLHPGPRSERFQSLFTGDSPGPTHYSIKRDFDAYVPPEKKCHARLPGRAPFNVTSIRIKARKEEGPSPASYNAVFKPCKFTRCIKAPFLASTKRFQEEIFSEDEEDYIDNIENLQNDKENKPINIEHTWQFKSNVERMKPLVKNFKEPSPADFPQPSIKVDRNPIAQHTAPYFSSRGRFRPWLNWIPIHGNDKTPGPAYYNLEIPKCYPAVKRGPLNRSPRFRSDGYDNPAPNEYKIGGGIETILNTHNQRLINNIDKQHKFHWEPPNKEEPILSFEELEASLLEKSIALLDIPNKPIDKDKLLRCFVEEKDTEITPI